MDDTPLDVLLTGLEAADPAQAPDLADELAARLAADLDREGEDAEQAQA